MEISSAEFFELGKPGFIGTPSALSDIRDLWDADLDPREVKAWIIFSGLLSSHEPRITGDAYQERYLSRTCLMVRRGH